MELRQCVFLTAAGTITGFLNDKVGPAGLKIIFNLVLVGMEIRFLSWRILPGEICRTVPM